MFIDFLKQLIEYTFHFIKQHQQLSSRSLGAFTKLRIVTVSFVMLVLRCVRPSVRMELLGSHWMDFH